MWYITAGDYVYNFTGILFGVLAVAFLLGVITVLNDGNPLYLNKRWQQILVRLCFIVAVVSTLIFACPYFPPELSMRNRIGGYIFSLVAIVISSGVVYFIAISFTLLIQWIFAKPKH
ncbi:MAG: hypothetical protein J6Y91_03670 [Alphaproteobacteria bacterium]|nr:hypothetical protein [Alphaproteobacteria bacterium]